MAKYLKMKSDETLQQHVQEAIKWETQIDAAEIGVTAKEGVVTLSGMVDSYTKKMAAEKAVKKIAGVKVIVENIKVDFGGGLDKTDNEIADEILNAFKWNREVPDNKITAKVEQGFVTLEGEVEFNYQTVAAKNAVSNLLGVKSVSNLITIYSEKDEQTEKADIEKALQRNWSIDHTNIEVAVSNHNVTLNGSVESWYEKDEAEQIARNAPGVRTVDNKLDIECDY